MPPTPIDGPGLGAGRDFALPSCEGIQDFPFLTVGHFEVIMGEAELRGDFIEYGGRDLQVEMCIAKLSAGVLKWPTGQRGDPQGSQPLEPRQPARVRLHVPFVQLGVRLDDLGFLQKPVAEVSRNGVLGGYCLEALAIVVMISTALFREAG